MKRKWFFIFAAFLMAAPFLPGEDPEYDVIYALNFFDGKTYSSTIVPVPSREIYILAGKMNVFVVRETSLYYWPLTNEYKADWAARNTALEGTLCVRDAAGIIRKIQPQPYLIRYDMNDIAGTTGVYWEQEASKKHLDFLKAQAAYSESVYAYNDDMKRYEREVGEFLEDPGKFQEFPAVPVPPENFSIMSTGIHIGFPVDLAEGTYTVYFEDPEGKIVPGTKKKLKAYKPINENSGFRIFEEGRWSVPADLPDNHMTVFTFPGTDLYLQPYHYLHYNSRAYRLMNNPQNKYSRDLFTTWVAVDEDPGIRRISIAGKDLELSGYKVNQIAGSRLGYVITPLDPGDSESSFTAFYLPLAEHTRGKTYPVGDTNRISVVNVFPGLEFLLLFISAIPVLVFVILRIKRRVK